MSSTFSSTDCPKCGRLVITIEDAEWADAQYLCCNCGSAFMFKKDDGKDDVDG